MSNNHSPYIIAKNVIAFLVTLLVLAWPFTRMEDWIGKEHKTTYLIVCAALSVLYMVCCWLCRKHQSKNDWIFSIICGAGILLLCLLLLL